MVDVTVGAAWLFYVYATVAAPRRLTAPMDAELRVEGNELCPGGLIESLGS